MIIAAVYADHKLRVTGISYVLNLAVVDLFITAWYLPIILANILAVISELLNDVSRNFLREKPFSLLLLLSLLSLTFSF